MGDMDDELPAEYDISGPGTTHQAEIDEIMDKHHAFIKKLSEEFDAKVAAMFESIGYGHLVKK